MNNVNILLTSVGRRKYLVKWFKEAGNIGKVHVGNNDIVSDAFWAGDERVHTPNIYDKNYIPFLLDYCRDNEIKAVIPLFDVDLPVLAHNRELFEMIGTRLIVADEWFVEICNDKYKTYVFLHNNGIRCIKTFIDLESVVFEIQNGSIKYPLIIKPRWGMGSIGIYVANNENELRVLYKKLKSEIFETYLKDESLADTEHCVVFQEYVDGTEYGADIVNDLEGNYITSIHREKLAMRSGETDCARMIKDNKIEEICRMISRVSKHVGLIDIDIIKKNGEYYVLEMNSRFGGGYPFSHIAGVHVTEMIVDWLSEQREVKEYDYPEGLIIQKSIGFTILGEENLKC